jgi:GH15 family glucan-1,4-alpha-glucosidase
MQVSRPIPYQALSAHGVIGDRRTAALIAADGTLDWLCLSDYEGDVIFGALLDAKQGGYWRLGPAIAVLGKQSYAGDAMSLHTSFDLSGSRLELIDQFAWPQDDRPQPLENQHAIVRHLRAGGKAVRCCLQLFPASNFAAGSVEVQSPAEARIRAGDHRLKLWLSRPILTSNADRSGINLAFDLADGDDLWAVLASDDGQPWSVARAVAIRRDAEDFWAGWSNRLAYEGPRRRDIRHSGRLIHLLTYAPTGSVVAGPTASLPERIGGDWNADYRLTWIRDSSLAMATLSRLGNTADARRFLEWLCRLDSDTESPLEVVYGIRGQKKMQQHENKELYGYRGSRPVRLGNHAYEQRQHDALGYLLDGALIYVEQGGEWEDDFSQLVRRVADYICQVWEKPGNSIWELSEARRYLSALVMSWVALDRATRLAPRLGKSANVAPWQAAARRIRAAVLEQGWSESLGAFRQHLEADNLDAAALLIPLMGLLPADDPRVVATVDRLLERLSFEGFLYRFDPEKSPGMPEPKLPLGEFEAAFLPCTFWMAAVLAMLGRRDEAEAILHRAQQCAGGSGLFAEAVDPRTDTMRGNTPLLFSHAEYVRAIFALEGRKFSG